VRSSTLSPSARSFASKIEEEACNHKTRRILGTLHFRKHASSSYGDRSLLRGTFVLRMDQYAKRKQEDFDAF